MLRQKAFGYEKEYCHNIFYHLNLSLGLSISSTARWKYCDLREGVVKPNFYGIESRKWKLQFSLNQRSKSVHLRVRKTSKTCFTKCIFFTPSVNLNS